MLFHTTPNTPPSPPLSSREEQFSLYITRGVSLAQAAWLAGYSPQGAWQRGSVLMADSDIRLRVEALPHAWKTPTPPTMTNPYIPCHFGRFSNSRFSSARLS